MVEATTQDGSTGFSAAMNAIGVGLNQIDLLSVQIHPNQTSDLIQIESIQPHKIVIRNLQRQIIKVNYHKSEISLAEIANGISMLQLYTNEGLLLLSQKTVKQ